jgi:hypothetical protein
MTRTRAPAGRPLRGVFENRALLFRCEDGLRCSVFVLPLVLLFRLP